MKVLEPIKPWFIEEPTAPDDAVGHATIRKALKPLGIQVATGEHAHNRVSVAPVNVTPLARPPPLTPPRAPPPHSLLDPTLAQSHTTHRASPRTPADARR